MRLPVAFTVSSSAMTACGSDHGAIVAAHRDVLDLWQRVGILVHHPDHARLIARLATQPVSVRKMWQEALIQLSRKPHVACELIDSRVDVDGLKALAGVIDVALLPSSEAARTGVTGENASWRHGPDVPEIGRFDLAIHHNNVLRHVKKSLNSFGPDR